VQPDADVTWDLAVVFDLVTGETTWHRADCKHMRTLEKDEALVLTLMGHRAPPPDDEPQHDCLKNRRPQCSTS